MKTLTIIPALFLSLVAGPLVQAQDTSTEELVEEGSNILNDPRLQNMFRTVQEDPERAATDAIQSIKANSDKADDAVEAATRLFQENQKEIEGVARTVTENRDVIQATATSAVSELNRMVPETTATAGTPASTPAGADAPATRPANTPVAATSAPPTTAAENIPSPAASVADAPIVQESTVTPIATAPVTESRIPDSPFLNPGDIPEPQALTPQYQSDDDGGYQANAKNEVVITSRESEMDSNAGLVTFLDNVVINHPQFILECDKLVITLAEGANEGGDSASFKRAVATGGTVKIRRISPDGTTQVAIARMADYNGITKDIVLSGGPPYIQDGDKFVECNSADSKIVMTGDGKYKITGSDAGGTPRSTIRFPVEDSGGDKSIGIGSSVGGSIDRLR